MLNRKKNNKGFTLVELLVVIAIIGILAVVAVPALFSNINKAKVADLEADYSAFKSAALSYYADNNVTTTSKEELGEYMESVPTKDPFGGTYELIDNGTKLELRATAGGRFKDGTKELEKLEKDLGENIVENDNTNGYVTITLISN